MSGLRLSALTVAASLWAVSTGAAPWDVPVTFDISTNAGSGMIMYVGGSIPQLGNWDVTRAIRMVATNCAGPTCTNWSITLGIPNGVSYEYKFLTRADSSPGDPSNGVWEAGANRTGQTPPGPPAPFSGKTLFYYSSWTNVSIYYSNTISSAWTTNAMTDIGPGRSVGERLWRAENLNRAGERGFKFVFTDNNGNFDYPPAGELSATTNACNGRVCVEPAPLVPGNTGTITYTPAGGPIASATNVCIHLGWNNWATVVSTDAPMTAVSNTWVYVVNVPEDATQLDCVFNDCNGTWDNNNTADWHFAVVTTNTTTPPIYDTPLDAFVVQDKELYNYWPPAFASTNRVETFMQTSSVPGVQSRTVRVYLPRGYNENTTKRYPVLYMHDGQNLFLKMGAFGASWNSDTNSASLVRHGRMRETIIVGVDNTSDRIPEYLPPECGGTGALYAEFLIEDVKATVDSTYRTLPDRENTGTAGSSLGGLITVYLGWDHSDVFGKAAGVSSSFTLCPGLQTVIGVPPKRDIRLYTDSGDDLQADNITARDNLVKNGYLQYIDYDNTIGYGQEHNEYWWDRRSPRWMEFLFSTSDEPNTVLDVTVSPPQITDFHLNGPSNVVTWTSYKGRTYQLLGTTALSTSTTWSNLYTTPAPAFRPWDYPSISVTNSFNFFRVRQITVPNWPN